MQLISGEAILDSTADEDLGIRSALREKGSTVNHAMSILRLLADRDQALGVNAIARELSIAPSTSFKILKSLLAEDFVEIDPVTKGYSLGTGAIMVARRALDPARAFANIRVRLDEMAEAYSIAICFWRTISHSRIVLAGFAASGNEVGIHMPVGKRLPLLMGAVGRAIAADLDLPDKKLKEKFDGLRWQTPISFESYNSQVRTAKAKGYAYDEGNFSPGVNTVAVTIRDEVGNIRYGLSAIMFNGQHGQAAVEQIGQDLIALSAWAGTRLFSRPLQVAAA